MNPKLIIFYYDDTLIQSNDYLYSLEVWVSQRLGMTPASREVYFWYWGRPYEEMVQYMHPDRDLDDYMSVYYELYDHNQLLFFDGAKEMLQRLTTMGILLAIVSAKQTSLLEEHLTTNKIWDLFSYIHGVDSSPYTKPDAKVFDNVVSFFDTIEKKDMIYIGDSLSDELAARWAGIPFIGVLTGLTTKEKFEWGASLTLLDSISDLPRYLTNTNP